MVIGIVYPVVRLGESPGPGEHEFAASLVQLPAERLEFSESAAGGGSVRNTSDGE